jgi:hypothetical protein
MNNGINDLRDGVNYNDLADQQDKCLEKLKITFPNARVLYSMPLSRSPDKNVDLLGQRMWKHCIDRNVTFIKHNINARLFYDEVHISQEGTKLFVQNIHSHTQDRLTTNNRPLPFNRQYQRTPAASGRRPYHQQPSARVGFIQRPPARAGSTSPPGGNTQQTHTWFNKNFPPFGNTFGRQPPTWLANNRFLPLSQ